MVALWKRMVAASWYFITMYILAQWLRGTLGEYYSVNVNLIWWFFGLLAIKYVHAVLAPTTFAQTIGLISRSDSTTRTTTTMTTSTTNAGVTTTDPAISTLSSFYRTVLFCYLPATIIFDQPPSDSNSRWRAIGYFFRGIVQLVVMGTVARWIIDWKLDERLPRSMRFVIAFYQIALSQGGIADVVMSSVTRGMLGQTVAIIEPSNVPVLTTSPRYFWHRWSSSAGYHLRKSIYEPLGGRSNQWPATIATFGTNCVLHVTWWGYVSEGKLAWNYIPLLLIGPLVALTLDKFVLVPLFKNTSKSSSWSSSVSNNALYHGASLVVLQVMASVLSPCFLDAHGFPDNLHDLALVQTGRL